MKIVLDFDDMIFNTHGLMWEFVKVFQKEGFNEDQFWQIYKQCKKRVGDFDEDLFIDLAYELKDFNREKVNKKINSIIAKDNVFVYSDFFDFVLDYKKEELILLSFGTTKFQKNKIENSGISKYFNEVIITSRNKADDMSCIKKKYNKNIIFIDDKAEAIDDVKKRLPNVVTMKMERPQGGHIDTESKLADYVIKELNEAKNIINKLNN